MAEAADNPCVYVRACAHDMNVSSCQVVTPQVSSEVRLNNTRMDTHDLILITPHLFYTRLS